MRYVKRYLIGCKCISRVPPVLDLFAGSGACTFEALSRGAHHVTCIDRNPQVIRCMRQNADILSANNLELLTGDTLTCINGLTRLYDIVFLDPPFEENLLFECLQQLIQQNCLSQNALIYFECERKIKINDIPKQLSIIKYKKKKNVQYGLAQFDSQPEP